MHTPMTRAQKHARAKEISEKAENPLESYLIGRKVVSMEEQLKAAKAALYESAKQHRYRGDHGHANLCETNASRIQIEESGPCKRCSDLKRLPNYLKKATTPCPDCNAAAFDETPPDCTPPVDRPGRSTTACDDQLRARPDDVDEQQADWFRQHNGAEG